MGTLASEALLQKHAAVGGTMTHRRCQRPQLRWKEGRAAFPAGSSADELVGVILGELGTWVTAVAGKGQR
jgi:hypothetical protein